MNDYCWQFRVKEHDAFFVPESDAPYPPTSIYVGTLPVIEYENREIKFKFLFDKIIYIPQRGGPVPVSRTYESEIKIFMRDDFMLYLVCPTKGIADKVKPLLSKALTRVEASADNVEFSGDEDFIESVDISIDKIREIAKETDVVEIKSGTWLNLEEHVPHGSLRGDLSQSKFYYNFETSGEPTVIRFESRQVGKTVAISSDGCVTFYGKNVIFENIEKYILNQFFKSDVI